MALIGAKKPEVVVTKNLRVMFDWFAERINIKTLEDWYYISSEDLKRHNVWSPVNTVFKGSISRALSNIYPEFHWQPWRFGQVPDGFWQDEAARKDFFDWFAFVHNFQSWEEWYKVKTTDFKQWGGSGMLCVYYNNSIIKAMLKVYPEHPWILWKFHSVPMKFWQDIKNQRKYFDWLAEELNLQSPSDWYNVPLATFNEKGAGGFLTHYYSSSISKALAQIYPEYEWRPWLFKNTPLRMWDDIKLQRQYFNWVGEQLGLEVYDDWYKVKIQSVYKYGGKPLLMRYDLDLIKALNSIYPEHEWLTWKFWQVPVGWWNDTKNQETYFRWLETQLKIQQPEDWLYVTTESIRQLKGATFLGLKGGWLGILQRFYPNIKWAKLLPKTGKAQATLFRGVTEIFPHENILSDYRHSSFSFSASNAEMELDIFLPSLSLAFEYQGVHHFYEVDFFGEPDSFKKRDEEKRKMCKESGITLIEIPFWWDLSTESLMATINYYRPDLVPFPGKGQRIPEVIPDKIRRKCERSVISSKARQKKLQKKKLRQQQQEAQQQDKQLEISDEVHEQEL